MVIKKEVKVKVYTNKCVNCGKVFPTQKASTNYCSDRCMKVYFENKYGEKNETNDN